MKKLTNAVLIVVLSSSFALVKAQEEKRDSLKTKEIQGVVVTALGIKKEKRALTYSTQEIGGDALVKVKDANPMNSLSGRVAGVNISRSSSGIGGSVKVTLRGQSSSRNNQPLYVIDGVPITNSTPSQPGSIFGDEGGSRDGGDVLSLINPDDIENINVLRGAASAALYGSQGANGVILITTKKGKSGKVSLNFNSNITAESAAYYPKLQYEYLATNPGQGGTSWGAKGSTEDYAKKFFKTGLTSINSVSLSASNNIFSSYLSYANTSSNGVIPTSRMNQNNFTFRETVNLFGDKLKVDASVNVSEQRFHNRPGNGLYLSPLVGLYAFPRGENYDDYTTNFERLNTQNYIKEQNIFNNAAFTSDIEQNPYWLLNRAATDENNKRAYMKGSISYVATDWLTFQARASYDYVNRNYKRRLYAGTTPVLAHKFGRYISENSVDTQWYTDIIATANKSFGKFDVSAVLGASRNDFKLGDLTFADSGFDKPGQGLKIPNYFVLGNFVGTEGIGNSIGTDKETKSVFGSAQFGFDKAIYLDVSARNDWSSALSESFFYPSVGLSTILNKYIDFGDTVKFLKLRGAYAQVGNDIPSFIQGNLSSTYGKLTGGVIQEPAVSSYPGIALKPELKKSWEAGLEARLFNNRVNFDFTYYLSNTTNQYFEINAGSNIYGVQRWAVNGGDIESKGIEASLNVIPFKDDNFEWSSTINFGTNKSYVKSLSDFLRQADGTVTATLTPLDNSFQYILKEGSRFGTIMVKQLAKDANGLAIFDNSSGTPTPVSLGMQEAGTPFPDWNAGWVNTFNYKNFTLNVVIDGKMGGKAVSTTQAMLDQAGVSQATADARNTNNGQILVSDGKGNNYNISAKEYYNAVGGRDGYTSEYVYDLSNFRLAEFSLGYNFIPKNSFIQKANISIVGRNLFFIYKKDKNIPFDPNVVSSTGEAFQGIEVFSQPSTRSIGVNLSVNF
ncbi:SusC/RagA family TonB-linked outer membrane protein [Cloacibacterium rupense]|uniref:SusC/RagA family TonB-linked outer membrane protein n=1 Tax=Cloacibacterium rupense TaxID=517423 RepID=A0ABQ2NGH5_9FLAO|nr:SusC/RagA family TonB-linked outer membrane protein [Cloacibacterium rupense]GGP02754.1 SusC/RagA family TonB-linked outer membrane protein [Cloacibacterium rupense]